jgi:hypothetical protein
MPPAFLTSIAIDGQHVSVRPRRTLAEMRSCVADRRDRLAGFHCVAREIDHRVAHAHPIGGVSARNDERVEILHACGAGGHVRRHDGFAALAGELRAGGGPDDRDGDAGVAQRLERPGQLAILEFLFDEQGYTRARGRGRVSHERNFTLMP